MVCGPGHSQASRAPTPVVFPWHRAQLKRDIAQYESSYKVYNMMRYDAGGFSVTDHVLTRSLIVAARLMLQGAGFGQVFSGA